MTTRLKLTWSSLGVMVLLGIALALRLKGLTATSLSVDECMMIQNAQGILNSGYPHRFMGSTSLPLSTYELLPYPVALFMGLFGAKAFFLRLPAVFFGVATTGLIYLVGSRLFSRSTGFVAALIYAFSPWAINWSQSLFHPAQDQFLGLLTIYLYYRGAVESPEMKPGYLFGSMASFSLAYLTWEGYGLFLPVFLLAMFVFKWENWSWMKSPTLWAASLLAVAVVILELCWRLVSFPPFLVIGNELRPLRTPTLAFLRADTDLWVSWRRFFWGENRTVLTFLALVGLPLIRRDRALAYLYLVMVSFAVFLTCLMEELLPHYFYGMLPLLVLIATRSLMTYLEKIGDLLPSQGAIHAGILKYGLILVALGGVFLASNNLDLRLYRLSYPPEEEPAFERKDFMWIDHRGGAEYLAQQAGTASVISNMGAYVQLFEATKCSCNYGAEYFPYAPLFYDYVGQGHTYLEKFAGAQTLRNPQELQEAFYQNKKLYLGMSAVDRLAGYSPEFFEFLQSHCQPVYNTFSLQVFLWNR